MTSSALSIQDNFLPQDKFDILKNIITNSEFPWYFNTNIADPDKEDTPGFFTHMIYNDYTPRSLIFDSIFCPILNMMNIAALFKIRMNLNFRLPIPYVSIFHIDILNATEFLATHSTTSILYINTNNGYTELETGEKIESIENRLVSFPLSTKHRVITQTDEQTRILINFNYLNHGTEK